MLREYGAWLLLFVFIVLNGSMMIGMSHMMSNRRATPVKDSPYESGIPPIGDARRRFSVKFYLVALLFVVFDVEIVFLFPWAAGFRQLGVARLIEILIFLVVLGVGLVYAWRRGALDWE